MAKFRNISDREINILMKGRRISIPAGSIVEGPDNLKNYRALKEVTDLDYDKHVKHMPKFLKANPMHKLRAFINANSNSSEYAMRLQEKPILDSNITNITESINYVTRYPRGKKPPIYIAINGSNKEEYKNKILTTTKYTNVIFVDDPNYKTKETHLLLSISDNVLFDYDFITFIARYSFNNKISLPCPFVISDLNKESLKKDILNFRVKKDVHFTIATLVNNELQYKDFLSDLLSQRTDYKFEIIAVPNFNNEFTGCAEPLNIALDLADGVIVNLCHQDLRVNGAWVEGILNHVTNFAKNRIRWGILGMAGAYKYSSEFTPDKDGNALYLSDLTKNSKKSYAAIYREVYGNYREVQTIDELSLIMRKDSPFRFDQETFDHYHWYGADICLQALSMGYKNFAIDADCHHLSDGQGNLSGGHADAFVESGIKLFKKWSKTFPYFKTTTAMFLSRENLFIPVIFIVINRKNSNNKLPEIIRVP